MTPSTDNELERRLRETFAGAKAVTDCWANPAAPRADGDLDDLIDVDASSPSRWSRRFAAPLTAAAVVLVVAGAAVAVAASRGGHGQNAADAGNGVHSHTPSMASSSMQPTAASRSKFANTATPSWVKRCIPPRDREAPGYVGHTIAELQRVAQQRGEKVIVYAADGKCVPRVAIGAPIGGPKLVAVATESVPSGGQKIIYAAYVNPLTGE